MKRIVADVDRCSGCRLCEVVCSFSHESLFGSSSSRISVVKEDVYGFDLPVACWHCTSCPALENCPSGAIERGSDGLIFVAEEKCVGCGKCVKLCRFGAVKLHPTKHTPLICDQCHGKPLCVEKCPTKALTFSEARKQRPKLPSKVLEETLKKWRIVA
jgi:carbon-monoxide dehydrogenase iron sulfur subunit